MKFHAESIKLTVEKSLFSNKQKNHLCCSPPARSVDLFFPLPQKKTPQRGTSQIQKNPGDLPTFGVSYTKAVRFFTFYKLPWSSFLVLLKPSYILSAVFLEL